MKTKLIAVGILALVFVEIVLISGCVEKECKTNDDSEFLVDDVEVKVITEEDIIYP